MISLASVEFGVIKIALYSDSVHIETVSDYKSIDLASTNQMMVSSFCLVKQGV